jgi:hypothetical protein
MLRQPSYSGPIGPVLLAPTTECPSPEPCHPVSKYVQPVQVPRYRVVVEVPLDDRLEPLSRLLDWIVHALAELLLDFLQLGPHALSDRLAFDGKVPVPVFPAYVRESQKIERFRLAFPSSFPVSFGKSPELDPARFIWVELQTKLSQPLP